MSELIKHTPFLWERKMPNCSFWIFWCSQCECAHHFPVGEHPTNWQFNGKIDCPTFTPSLMLSIQDEEGKKKHVCHLNLTDGVVIYHADIAQKLAGQRLPLAKIAEGYGA
jgi:hypothetical protein